MENVIHQVFAASSTFNIVVVLTTILAGGVIGYLVHKYVAQKQFAKVQKKGKTTESGEFNGKMNTDVLRKPHVNFSSEFCDNESMPSSKKYEVNEEETEEDEVEDEEEMPELEEEDENEQEPEEIPRKRESLLLDSNRINATIGKLHGKLATAQLKAKTRQMESEMSNEEKEYEERMKANQMASIMKMMMDNPEKFGMDTEQIKEQMNLYNF
ncbi:unnamed protein product [Caenorhabditis sp. 36 PRJEB53466]|nr:unnamed protein product [Caenorhabditis sp. 36 PRJEB53466]